MNALRPSSFSEYVGQRDLVERLKILVGAARARREAMGHTLLYGPAGLGKTTLAHIIANELGTRVHIVMGPSIEKPSDIHSMLGRLAAGDILFVDEIHSANRVAMEAFYSAMEDQQMHVMIDCKEYSRSVTFDLPPFTLIGATTQPGLLEAPLRDRFGIPLALNYYEDADLMTILTANAHTLGLVCETAALSVLASRSRGTPRIANSLLAFCRDFAAVRGEGYLTVELANAALKMQGIDNLGLSQQDRQYLQVLISSYGGGPAGANALAMTLGIKEEQLSSVIEPYLLRESLIARTGRGRKVTDKAVEHLAKLAA